MSPDAQSGTAPRNARTDAAPFAHPVRKFRSSRTGRTSSQWALAPVDFVVLARARARCDVSWSLVPMTMPLAPTLYGPYVPLVVFTGRTPIPVLIVHVLSFQTYLSALLPLAPLPVEPLPRSLNDLTSVSWSVRSFAQPRAAARAPQTRPCRPWAADRLRCTPRAW